MSQTTDHLTALTLLVVVVAANIALLTVITCGCSAQLLKRFPLLDAGLQRLLLALTVISLYLASTLADTLTALISMP